ncbi:MAG: rhodanese-like domain-containing protein, partial [Fimbriimonadaceae bacterium]
PGHGAGSACGKGLGGVPVSSLGYERKTNIGLKQDSLEAFTQYVLNGQPEPPAYFKEMKRVNRIGPDPVSCLSEPPQSDPRLLGNALAVATLVDIRQSLVAEAGFVKGAMIIPESKGFTTWAGSLISYRRPIYLVADSVSQVRRAVADLRLIGLDEVVGWFLASDLIGSSLAKVATVSADRALDEAHQGRWQLLDVRGQAEFDQGHHSLAVHIPLGSLPVRIQELDPTKPIAVHCAAGSRSPMAASILVQNGFAEVYDLVGGYAEIQAMAVTCM